MADELIWRTLFASDTGDTQYDAAAELRNDSSRDMLIRKNSLNVRAGVLTDDDEYGAEISTDPTFTTAAVNGDPGYRLVAEGQHVIETTGAAQVGISKTDSYGRGQLVLEPGESLYLNMFADAGSNVIAARAVIGWEFR